MTVSINRGQKQRMTHKATFPSTVEQSGVERWGAVVWVYIICHKSEKPRVEPCAAMNAKLDTCAGIKFRDHTTAVVRNQLTQPLSHDAHCRNVFCKLSLLVIIPGRPRHRCYFFILSFTKAPPRICNGESHVISSLTKSHVLSRFAQQQGTPLLDRASRTNLKDIHNR